MADTTTITLAKALKLKNRLAGRVTKLTDDIKEFNSVQEGAERPDVPALFAERAVAVAGLTELKAAITRANQPIQKAIYELAEKKAEAALVGELPTKHGTFQEGYPTAGAVTYVAQVRKADADARVAKLERDIDALQDRLDAFNHETRIEVAAATVLAAGE